jgi:SP family general alpha glucoside:H+ symporter-like MFS transporter
MADHVEKSHGGDIHVEKAITPLDDTANLDAKAQAAQYKMAAIEAENAEHDMGVLQAVKEYPMAAWWAFVMSCTIVSHLNFLTPIYC